MQKNKQGSERRQAGLSRNCPDVQPDEDNRGASSAVPREGTARTDPVSPVRERRPSLGRSVSGPAELERRQDGRVSWTTADNALVMRAHFIAKEIVEETGQNYRKKLLEIWKDIYPERQVTIAALANRVGWILQKQKLSQPELELIRKTLRPTIEANDRTTREETDRVELVEQEKRTAQGRLGLAEQEDRTAQGREVKLDLLFRKNIMLYIGIPQENKPPIPKVNYSKQTIDCVSEVNQIIVKQITQSTSILELVDMVYAGAQTVCEAQGLRERTSVTGRKGSEEPAWRKRLEKKITDIRKKVGVVQAYLNSNSPTRKQIHKVQTICSNMRIKGRMETQRNKISELLDNMKQKIKALGNRLRRYNENTKRHRNNNMFWKSPKKFYMNIQNQNSNTGEMPEQKDLENFWGDIWAQERLHNENARWIEEMKGNTEGTMNRQEITIEDIQRVINKSSNWAAPGVDHIQNYWWKQFKGTHKRMAELFQQALEDPAVIPNQLTQGITYMIPKGKATKDPAKYRPITCLPTIYKILTGTINIHISRYLGSKEILAMEQAGCKKSTKGCKELLLTDYIVTKQAKRKLRNISIAWVDYKKAYDSVPHSWLLKVLELYGIERKVCKLLAHLMGTWRTSLIAGNGTEMYRTANIPIKCGIFQGDSLSPMWFCLALNPLSSLLNNASYGYHIDKHGTRITHQLYMDDLKLYAANKDQIQRQLEIVAAFSRDICMEFGIEKCAIINVHRGKISNQAGELHLMDNTAIPTIGAQDRYKYLGMQQALDIRNTEMKEVFKKQYFERLNLILKAKLNAKAMIMAINTWVLPTISYSFGVIRWSTTDLKAIDTKTRTELTRFGIHHPHSSVARLYLPRINGGRGLRSVETVHIYQVNQLKRYFKAKTNPFHQALCAADNNFTILHLNTNEQPNLINNQELIQEWTQKLCMEDTATT